MNATEKIVTVMQQALRGEALESDALSQAMTAALALPDLHELGCAMIKTLVEHHQSGLHAQRALLLVQMGRGSNV